MTASKRINIRCTPALRDKIDVAAERVGLTRSAFIISAAVERARGIVMDQLRAKAGREE